MRRNTRVHKMSEKTKLKKVAEPVEGTNAPIQGPLEVDWQLRKSSWSEQNRFLLENAVWTDCVFVVGADPEHTKRFACHKLLLGKTSPVFGAMLFGDLADPEDIQVTDIEPQTFQAMLDFIYTGSVNLAVERSLVLGLCLAADKYMLGSLKQRCFDDLQETLTPDTACRVLELACLLGNEQLEKRAWMVIKKRTDEVLSSRSFVDAEPTTLLKIAEEPELHVDSELPLIMSVFKWAKSEAKRCNLTNSPKDLRLAIGPIFKHLRFQSLTQSEFADGPGSSDILTDNEKVVIYKNMCSAKSRKNEVFDELCTVNSKRVKLDILIPNFVFSQVQNILLPAANYYNYRTPQAPGISCFVTFQTDLDVHVTGIYTPPGSGISIETPPIIIVLDDQNVSLDTGGFNMVVDTATNNIFKFKKPIYITAKKEYSIMVASQTGYCVVGSIQSYVAGHLYVDESSAANPNGGFITGLVYKCCV